MNTNEQRRLWAQMLDTELHSLYFGELVQYYNNLEHWLTIGVLTSSAFTVGTLLLEFNRWVPTAISALALLLSLILVVKKFSQQAERCADLHAQHALLVAQYEDLWDNLETQNDFEAKAQWKTLIEVLNGLSKTATSLPNREERLRYWQAHVMKKRGLA